MAAVHRTVKPTVSWAHSSSCLIVHHTQYHTSLTLRRLLLHAPPTPLAVAAVRFAFPEPPDPSTPGAPHFLVMSAAAMSASVVAPPQLVGSLMDESGLACDKSGNLSKPNPLPSTASSLTTTTTTKRTKPVLQQQQQQQADNSKLLLLQAEAAKRSKTILLNDNIDQLNANKQAALQRQLEDEDRAFTLPHIRGALPSESIAFLKWKGSRDGQSMWQAWMDGLDELEECRRRYRTVKRRMTQQREQLLQLRLAEDERRATRRANEQGVEVMHEDEYERYVQLVQAQKAYMADETERVAAKQQLSDWLARMSELQVAMCDSFLAWFDEKYANGKPRSSKPLDAAAAVDRQQKLWQVPAAVQEDKAVKVGPAVEEQKEADGLLAEARVVEAKVESTSGVTADVQLNLADVAGSKPGSSASTQKKDIGTSRSKVSRNTTSRA